MRSIIVFLIVTLGPFAGFSQDQLVIQVKQGKVWGYIDISGKTLIQPKYRHCEEFSRSGYAPVYIDAAKQWIFIKPDGSVLNLANDLKFKTAFGFNVEGFHDGMLAVTKNDKWGFVDTSGKLVIPLKYDRVSRFNEGFGWGELNGSYVLIDKSGNENPIQIPGIDELRNFSDGLIPFRLEGKMFGYLNTKGEIAIKAQFMTVGYFVDGVAWARDSNDKLGYIDKEGKWIIEPTFDFAVEIDPVSSLARVKKGDSWFYVSMNGEQIIMSDTELWEDFKEGLAIGRKGKS